MGTKKYWLEICVRFSITNFRLDSPKKPFCTRTARLNTRSATITICRPRGATFQAVPNGISARCSCRTVAECGRVCRAKFARSWRNFFGSTLNVPSFIDGRISALVTGPDGSNKEDVTPINLALSHLE